MQDEKHYNYWEQWFKEAYGVEDFSAMNTLWLSYFIAGGTVQYNQQKFAFKRVLQTVYTSLPDIIGVLFLASKCKRLISISFKFYGSPHKLLSCSTLHFWLFTLLPRVLLMSGSFN